MFDTDASGIELSEPEVLSGESEDRLAYLVTVDELSSAWTGGDRQVLPSGFEDLPISYLAVLAGGVDRSRLNGHDAVRLMQAEQRLSSVFEASKLATMVEVATSPPGGAQSPVERSDSELAYAADEIAAALTLTRRDSEAQLDRALTLAGSLSRVWERFGGGGLSLRKVCEFVRILGHLPQDLVDRVLGRTIDAAAGLTTGQLRARLQRLVLEADPEASKHGLEEGLAGRKVVSYQNPDLTGSLGILSAHPRDVAAAMSYLDSIARGLKTAEEVRTLDQIRNDVALDLLRGKRFKAEENGGRVDVTVSLTTLLGLSEQPGELNGFGPVTAEIARKTVTENVDGDWTFTVTDNGHPVATGTLARRPTRAQKRQIRAGYGTCVFPGCRQPAIQCDLDHRKPVSQGGPTHTDNLGPLCRHHHMARHHAPWLLRRKRNGDHIWTSPLGHAYTRNRAPPDE